MSSTRDGETRTRFELAPAPLVGYLSVLMVISWFAATILHELGHALVGSLLGIPVRSISISPFGWGQVTFSAAPGEVPRAEWSLVAASGVGTGLILGYALLLARRLWQRGHYLVQPLIAMIVVWLIIADPAYLALAAAGFGDGVAVARGLGVPPIFVTSVAVALVLAGRWIGGDQFRVAFRPFRYLGTRRLLRVWRGWLAVLALFFIYQTAGIALFGIN